MKIKGQLGEYIAEAAQRAINAFADNPDTEVVLVFNDVEVPVVAGMTAGDVSAEYSRIQGERHAAYVASPEYEARQRTAEEAHRQKTARLTEVLSRASKHLTLRDPAEWEKTVAANRDGYGGAVMEYAERWARAMEAEVAAGKSVADCAEDLSHLADTDGITGFMYGCAVSILAQVWVYGDDLRRWREQSRIGEP